MTDQAPGSGSPADQPADGARDPGAPTPSPWSRESSGAGAHPLGSDDPAPGPDPLPPGAPPAYGPPAYGPPPGSPAPYDAPQPWSQPPTAGHGEQPGRAPWAEPAASEPTPPWAQPSPGSGHGMPEQPPGPVAGYGVTPYPGGYGGTYPEYGTTPDHPQSTAALVTGIVALVTGVFCGVGGLVGIASIVLGAKARRDIDGDPARYGGRGKATAGLVMGVIALVVLVIWALIFVLILASSPA